ncbi:MAG TPA: serine/threonine-protein kinase [Terriglobales bacterium]|nr:serine/threonine-protein kinase [Terriglobales bacterium]
MSLQKLGRYEIVREIGHGAMGVVYEAVDPTIGRKIALKAIRFDGIGTTADEAARRFKNEARAAGGLNHPNIVTIYDAGEDNGILYLAMEFIEGSTLDVLLRTQRTLSPTQATDIVRQICAGLDCAHSKGIVHRDVKPANIMLAPHGLVKITDFGIARAGEAMTMTGQVVGTPNYMSPEQVLGKPLDGRSDLFSVGVMLYEMITGERPFEGQSITTIMYKIVHETPIPPKKLDASIHRGLSAVIEKSLAKAPEERFQTGAELSEALQNYERMVVPESTLGAPTITGPSLVDANATIDAAPPATRPRTATQIPVSDQKPATSATSAQDVRDAFRGFLVHLLTNPKARKRLIIVLIGIFIWLISTRGHDHDKDNQDRRANTNSAAAPVPPVPPAGADNSENASSNSEPVVTKRENATAGAKVAVLKVSSNPPTAHVYLDGKPTGKQTPTELQLPRGRHTVSVRMDGFQPSTATFGVKGGEELEYHPQLAVAIPNINVPGVPDLSKLQQLKDVTQAQMWQKWADGQLGTEPQLILNSRPPGARILIDGKDSGSTTPAQIPEKPGTYHVRLELDGFVPAEKTLTVGEHKPGVANVKLQPSGSE